MYKNKNKRVHLAIAKKNNRSISTDYTVVTAVLDFVKEKKSAAGNTYFFCSAQTLNRKDLFVKYERKKDRNTKEDVPFDPPMKRVKTVDKETGEESEKEVLDEKYVVQQDEAFGYILRPGASIRFNTFDRLVSTLSSGTICKLSLIADFYKGDVSFKVGSVMTDADPTINAKLYKKYVQGSVLAEIPTKDNIDPSNFSADTDPKWYGRSFILPISDDTETFREVSIALDCDDPDRFWAKVKEPAKSWPSITDPETKFVSVNMPVGDKVVSTLSVIYTAQDDKRTYIKFGFNPKVWECFGITSVDKWAKSAGRLIFNAKEWFAYGSSRLVDIKKMAANADNDDGLDFGQVVMCSDGDGGYGGYNDFEGQDDDNAAHVGGESPEEVDYTTTGYITGMAINLQETVRAAGIELPRSYVEEVMARGKYKYTFDPKCQPENNLNKGWMLRIERREKAIYNVTEFDELSRQPFLEETRSVPNLTFYGIFPVGDDSPYEHVTETNHDIAAFARENKMTPSTIYAVIE